MHPLDNPTWAALNTYQSHWAMGGDHARRFPVDVCVHGGFAQATQEAWESLAGLAPGPVSLFSLQPLEIPQGWTVTRKVELYEMVQHDFHEVSKQPGEAEAPAEAEGKVEIVELASADVPEMSALYAATRPGRKLSPRLHELGGFLGVKRQGRLAAMGCLRLHFPGFREISTVGTLPEFQGHGYATALVSALARRVHAAGETTFLTVGKDNARAIALYRRLGFRERALLHSTTVRFG